MIFRWWNRKKLRDLDARVAEAEAEAQLSQRRLEQVRHQVVRPLRERESQNQFADLIRRSLQPRSHNG